MTSTPSGFWPVVAALSGNLFVTFIKFVAAMSSGSSALFSEAVHSLADSSNQILILVGLTKSKKGADEEHVYGYGRERFFWAVISACSIFFVGAGVTLYHGVHALINPEPVVLSYTVFFVLAVSAVIEGLTFLIAVRELYGTSTGETWVERLEQADSATLSVLLEDGVALLGIGTACAALYLSYVTGNPVWDALGSIIVGLLLAAVALILVAKNRSYLIGRAMPEEMQEAVVELLVADPTIERVLDVKSATLDIGVYRLKCEVEINGHALLDDYFKKTLQDEFDEIGGDYETFKRFAVQFADRIPRLIGRRVDALEAEIQKRFPGIRYIDIEVN